jgi:sulfoxide reductase heme-binding subunit YedZ
MTAASPTHYIWWLISRASGIVAVTLVSISVLIGLAMAAKLVPGRRKRGIVALHEHLAVATLAAIAVHGGSLLGDGWLRPGLAGITIPFVLHYRPAFTGAGILAGYLAVLLGPTFYLRRRIGARTWRRLHRVTPLIWMLAVVHTLGAGSDAATLWLRCAVLLPVAPIVYVLAVRALRRGLTPSQAKPVASSAHPVQAVSRSLQVAVQERDAHTLDDRELGLLDGVRGEVRGADQPQEVLGAVGDGEERVGVARVVDGVRGPLRREQRRSWHQGAAAGDLGA